MPTLLETQTAMRMKLLRGDGAAIAAMLAPGVEPDRLDIYRNTCLHTLTRALGLAFPAVRKLVGEDFFDAMALAFIADHPPGIAWLDQYGAEWPDFLASFQPAASIRYLADVARLEWAVNCALHAPDVVPLELAKLAAIAPSDQPRVCLVAMPSLRLLRLDTPSDAIWRAVLATDDEALAGIDPDAGPVRLLVERHGSVEISRLDAGAWSFLSELCVGRPLEAAIDPDAAFDHAAALAEHLAAARFAGFTLAPAETVAATGTPHRSTA